MPCCCFVSIFPVFVRFMALASWARVRLSCVRHFVLPSFARVFAVGREATSMQVHVNEDRLGLGRPPWRLRRLRLLAHFGGPKVGSHARPPRHLFLSFSRRFGVDEAMQGFVADARSSRMALAAITLLLSTMNECSHPFCSLLFLAHRLPLGRV